MLFLAIINAAIAKQTLTRTNKKYENVDRVLKGEYEAILEFIQIVTPIVQARVGRVLFRYRVQSLGRDVRQETEDLCQEVFASLFADNARVLRDWDSQKGLSLENFVGLVAERQAGCILRKGKRNPWNDDPTAGEILESYIDESKHGKINGTSLGNSGNSTAEEQATNREILAQVLEEMRVTLSPLGYEIFNLIYIEELSVKEVCIRMNMKQDAVYAWRRRITELSRHFLSQIVSNSGTTLQKP